MDGNYGSWDSWLPLVQLSLNQHFNSRTASSAFDLLFNRPFNGFEDFSAVPIPHDIDSMVFNHQESWRIFNEAVLPGLKACVAEVKRLQRVKMDLRKQAEELLPGDAVWIQDVTRSTKWAPAYEGPFVVFTVNPGGTYTLLDAAGDIYPRAVPISQIKLAPAGIDATVVKLEYRK